MAALQFETQCAETAGAGHSAERGISRRKRFLDRAARQQPYALTQSLN
jgi:hypothetical protein